MVPRHQDSINHTFSFKFSSGCFLLFCIFFFFRELSSAADLKSCLSLFSEPPLISISELLSIRLKAIGNQIDSAALNKNDPEAREFNKKFGSLEMEAQDFAKNGGVYLGENLINSGRLKGHVILARVLTDSEVSTSIHFRNGDQRIAPGRHRAIMFMVGKPLDPMDVNGYSYISYSGFGDPNRIFDRAAKTILDKLEGLKKDYDQNTENGKIQILPPHWEIWYTSAKMKSQGIRPHYIFGTVEILIDSSIPLNSQLIERLTNYLIVFLNG